MTFFCEQGKVRGIPYALLEQDDKFFGYTGMTKPTSHHLSEKIRDKIPIVICSIPVVA